MAYITSRNGRFCVVTYDGIDPVTGKERRRWQPAGQSRADAEAIVASLTAGDTATSYSPDALTLGTHLTETWLTERQNRVRPTTLNRYRWIIEHYIAPHIGTYQLRSIRTDHLDALYRTLVASGGHNGGPLAPKTVHEVHLVVNSALRDAQRKGLVRVNAAEAALRPVRHRRSRQGPETWTVDELRSFLGHAAHHRLYPHFTSPPRPACVVENLRGSTGRLGPCDASIVDQPKPTSTPRPSSGLRAQDQNQPTLYRSRPRNRTSARRMATRSTT